MTIYDVIHLVDNADNVDRLDRVFDSWCFNTSVMTPEVRQELQKQVGQVAKMGELRLYKYLKGIYGLKM